MNMGRAPSRHRRVPRYAAARATPRTTVRHRPAGRSADRSVCDGRSGTWNAPPGPGERGPDGALARGQLVVGGGWSEREHCTRFRTARPPRSVSVPRSWQPRERPPGAGSAARGRPGTGRSDRVLSRYDSYPLSGCPPGRRMAHGARDPASPGWGRPRRDVARSRRGGLSARSIREGDPLLVRRARGDERAESDASTSFLVAMLVGGWAGGRGERGRWSPSATRPRPPVAVKTSSVTTPAEIGLSGHLNRDRPPVGAPAQGTVLYDRERPRFRPGPPARPDAGGADPRTTRSAPPIGVTL